jgi:hypothetical protein
LSFRPREFLGETDGVARQAAIALTLGQVVALDEAGIDGFAGGQGGQPLRNGNAITEYDYAVNLNDTTMFPGFDNLGVQQLWWRYENRLGIPASTFIALWLLPGALYMQQCIAALG